MLKPYHSQEKILLQAKPARNEGHIVLCLYRGQFVIWYRDPDGCDYSGDYCNNLEIALKYFKKRD